MQKRIAVIGCGGFIGSHLLRALLAADYEVEGWDLDDHRIGDLLRHPRLTFHLHDYGDPDSLAALSKHSTVIQLAALCNPSLYNTEDLRVIESNYLQPMRLAQVLAKSGTWLIYFSTSEVYGRTISSVASDVGLDVSGHGDSADTLHEDSTPLVLGPVGARRWSYACAKQLTERSLVALQVSDQLEWTVVRPFNFLGPAMDYIPGIDGNGVPRVLACFMDALLHGRPLELVDGGTARRCFTWIGDAVEAVMAILANHDKSLHQCFNIGTPENEISMADLAFRLHTLFCEVNRLPVCELKQRKISGLEFYGPGYEDSDRRLPDVSKAKELLDWSASTSLDDTLRKTLQWYVTHYQNHDIRSQL